MAKVNKGLKRNSYGILWLLKQKHKSTEPEKQAPAQPKPYPASSGEAIGDDEISAIDGKHIMISYNRDTRDLCLRIKEDLEKSGFRVWIDVEEIHGSSLESMAHAVENSLCVLMCMTEKYKMSPYCRAEAEYTFQLGRPFVPLIMQDNYKPDGWLGKISYIFNLSKLFQYLF